MTQRELLRDRPQCFQHGDYHIGNMMVDQDGLAIIDFDRYDFGDPWEEFNRIVWCAQTAPAFACGMVDGYFGGPPAGGILAVPSLLYRQQHAFFHLLGAGLWRTGARGYAEPGSRRDGLV